MVQKDSVPKSETDEMHDILKDVLGDNNLVNFPISPVSKNIEVKQIASDMHANKTEKVAPVQPAK